MSKTSKFTAALTFVVLFFATAAFSQLTDPGVQGGQRCRIDAATGINVCTGSGVPSVQQDNPAGILAFFTDGFTRFQDVEGVANSPTNNNGLGPRFNFNQCSGCHAQPAVGGTGAAVNPQFAGFGSCASTANLSLNATAVKPGQPGAPQTGTIVCNNTNSVPSFITRTGPTREARFPFMFNADGSVNVNNPNGGVEDLFTVTGRPDGATAKGCSLPQPSFAAAAAAGNIIFRIPTPVFGMGLLENLDDSTLQINRAGNLNNNFGIGGDFNHNGNDGTITRFGWKAQNKSGHIFAGEAYNVEMGISNLLFTQDRPLPAEDGNGGSGGTGLPASCLNLTGTGYPEDNSNPTNAQTSAAPVLDDVSAFANFMRSLAAPVPSTTTPGGATAISNGAAIFNAVGCGTCHNPTLGPTQVSNFTPSLSQQTVHAFTDLEFHHMGAGLADNVSQGGAGGDQFRTAPLWGLGQRIFMMHDGRATNLIDAINAHVSDGSEANNSVANLASLSNTQIQEVLDFLRSL